MTPNPLETLAKPNPDTTVESELKVVLKWEIVDRRNLPRAASHRQVGLVPARKSLCRGFGSSRFTERFHRDALVTHFQHGKVFCAARQMNDYTVARCRLHQRAAQRGHPTDVVAVEIDLVGAYDAH